MAIWRIVSARYDPQPLPNKFVYMVQFLLAFNAIVRGLDYVTGQTSRVADIVTIGTVINQLVNLEYWGWIFLIFGVVLAVALLTHRHFFTFLGHGVLLAAYAMLGVSSAQVVIVLHDDYRALIAPLSGILLNGYFAIRLKPWPREVIAPTAASRRSRETPEGGEDREEYL